MTTPEEGRDLVDDHEGLELTLEVLSDHASLATLAASLGDLRAGEPGVSLDQVRRDLQHRREPGD